MVAAGTRTNAAGRDGAARRCRQCSAMPRARRTDRFHVYVVLLDDQVWNEPSYRKANPDKELLKPCLYVGMTGLDPRPAL